ncbi:GntR family transcriptional regulator [Clostridium sp. cel8]|jgi:GntR family transcriptional regulator|uniref:GntR family transcriptional regulator n=1 Tax=unclassified Clostridium TaxID=2614128 RepID=UPI0015F73E34|nr:GntR family transcriptional regulator [Clostridium sp. cel8]MBA5849959.1 GntR family transcriptional regulator [Clostridium sp. cel8]
MLIEIDFDSEIPIYEQLKRQIIEGIASGKLKKGETLPSVRQMAEDIGINLHTVNKAYNELKTWGYLNVDRRKGTTISEVFPKASKEFRDKLKEELMYLISDAHLKGVNEKEFIDMCINIFKKLEL